MTGWYLGSVVIAERDGPDALHKVLVDRVSSDSAKRLRAALAQMDEAEQALLNQRKTEQARELRTLKRWAAALGCLFVLFVLATIAYASRLLGLTQQDIAQLETSAETDMLTGLSNRRALEGAVRRLEGKAMSIILFDLDDFKPINDRFGHSAGDTVLKVVAERLKQQFRDGDVVARTGGDEFVIVMPGMEDLLALQRIHERLGRAIAQPIDIQVSNVTVGASIGYAMSSGDRRFQRLAESADDMSYAEKKRRKMAAARA